MNDINFIKKCCKYAKGFEEQTLLMYNMFIGLQGSIDLTSGEFLHIQYPLLLQRAIEGLNESYADGQQNFEIIQTFSNISVFGYKEDTLKHFEWDVSTSMTAKRLALEYVFEHEDLQSLSVVVLA